MFPDHLFFVILDDIKENYGVPKRFFILSKIKNNTKLKKSNTKLRDNTKLKKSNTKLRDNTKLKKKMILS